MNSLLLVFFAMFGDCRTDTLVSSDGSRAALVVPVRTRQAKTPKLPLVIWLHGGIGANNPAKGLTAAQGFTKWADSGGFALLTPSAWPASPWWSLTAKARLQELVEKASKVPGVGTRVIVLAGVSDGGSGALWLAEQLRGTWGKRLKGVAIWSSDPSVMASQGIPFDLSALKGLPVRWMAGQRDHLYPFEDVASWWDRARANGVVLEPLSDPTADHDLSFHQQDLGRFPKWLRSLATP